MKCTGSFPIKGCIYWQNLAMHAYKLCPSPIPVALIFIIVLALAGPHSVLAGPEASVRKIVAGQEQNQRTGTGFYIHPNILATSFHVVQGAETITAELDEGKVQIRALLAFDPDLDLAFLYTPIRGTPLPLGGEFLQPWTKLQTLGFSQGKSLQKIPVVFEDWERIKGIWHLRIQGPVQPGMSGGPVVNDQGRVLGMNRYTSDGSESSRAWAVEIQAVHRTLNQALAQPVFTAVSSFARQTGPGPTLRIEDKSIVITDE